MTLAKLPKIPLLVWLLQRLLEIRNIWQVWWHFQDSYLELLKITASFWPFVFYRFYWIRMEWLKFIVRVPQNNQLIDGYALFFTTILFVWEAQNNWIINHFQIHYKPSSLLVLVVFFFLTLDLCKPKCFTSALDQKIFRNPYLYGFFGSESRGVYYVCFNMV